MKSLSWLIQAHFATPSMHVETCLITLCGPTRIVKNASDAESACGGIIKRHGTVRTTGSVDGMSLPVKWNAMDVKVPILSVRRLCHDHHHLYVAFNHSGGYLFNVRTKEQIPILEYQGVYYLKMKIDPPEQIHNVPVEPVFSRPVTAA